MHVPNPAELLDSLPAFQLPVFEKRDGKGLYGGAFQAYHRVNPLADAGILLEEGRVNQIKASGVGQLTIDHDDLAMQPHIGTHKQQPQEFDGQGDTERHAALTKPLGLFAAQESVAAQRIDQEAAGYAAGGSASSASATASALPPAFQM